MGLGLNLLSSYMNMSIENIVLITIVCGNLIFFAKDFKLGNLISLIIHGGLFILFYQFSMNWSPFIIMFFLHLLIMVFTLFAVDKVVSAGGFI